MIHLGDRRFGSSEPFPVLSLPILIAGQTAPSSSKQKQKGKGKGSNTGPPVRKQEQIERRLLLYIPTTLGDGANESLPILTLREDTSYDLDKKIWDSGLGLSSWLSRLYGPQARTDFVATEDPILPLNTLLAQDAPLRVIELGCGSGLVSLVLASLLHVTRTDKETSIVATDLESAMPLVEHNFTANSTLHSSASLASEPLDWEGDPSLLAARYPQGHDLIILADVTYNTDMFPPLLRTLDALLRIPLTSQPPKPAPLVLLAYKERDPAERTLFDLARQQGVEFRQIDTLPGAGGAPIEIYIGRFQVPK